MSEIFKDLDAIVSESIQSNKIRNDFISLLTTDFVELLNPRYKVLHVFDPNPEETYGDSNSQPSHYFYVFTAKANLTLQNLLSIISIVNKTIVKHPYDNYKDQNKKRRILDFQNMGFVKTVFDSEGNLKSVVLRHCVLLIRIADHDVTEKHKPRTQEEYRARKSIVNDLRYYNVEEAKKYVKLEYDGFIVPKQGKDLVIHEFKEKLKHARVDPETIDIIINKVKNIF